MSSALNEILLAGICTSNVQVKAYVHVWRYIHNLHLQCPAHAMQGGITRFTDFELLVSFRMDLFNQMNILHP